VRRLAAPSDEPITVVRVHYVKAGCEAQFEAELKKYMAAFTALPANLGITIFRPGPYQDGVYRIVYKFASQAELDRWHATPAYHAWITSEQQLAIAPPRTETLSGLETWFTLPGQQTVLTPPTRARQALVTWIAALPVSIVISILTGPFLDNEPFLVQKVVFITLLVVILTWAVMPLATRIFFRFLYPGESGSPVTE
jgi:uncharacterized protein